MPKSSFYSGQPLANLLSFFGCPLPPLHSRMSVDSNPCSAGDAHKVGVSTSGPNRVSSVAPGAASRPPHKTGVTVLPNSPLVVGSGWSDGAIKSSSCACPCNGLQSQNSAPAENSGQRGIAFLSSPFVDRRRRARARKGRARRGQHTKAGSGSKSPTPAANGRARVCPR